jgi:hypothetical protein
MIFKSGCREKSIAMKKRLLKTVAIFAAFSLVATSVNPVASASSPSKAEVSLVPLSTLEIPSELGLTGESFHGKSGQTIIFLQDAHDSLEAQENIAKIINHLVAHNGV